MDRIDRNEDFVPFFARLTHHGTFRHSPYSTERVKARVFATILKSSRMFVNEIENASAHKERSFQSQANTYHHLRVTIACKAYDNEKNKKTVCENKPFSHFRFQDEIHTPLSILLSTTYPTIYPPIYVTSKCN